FQHRCRKAFVHGEALARPIAGGAEAAQLHQDRAARLLLPRPHALQEFFAAHFAAADIAFARELTLYHHLRGDAGVVGARLPKHALAPEPLEADEDVLQRIVKRVSDVQGPGHVRRRDDDAENFRARRVARFERAGFLPGLAPDGLHGLWIERRLD